MITQREGEFTAQDGLRLFYRTWKPAETRAVLVVVHGLGEHSGRYGNPADYFAPRGYALYALDHRGHGQSEGQRGHVSRFDEFLNDLGTFISLVKERAPGKKTFLVSHSLGGVIALVYALHYPDRLAGVITSGAALGIKARVPAWKTALGKALSGLVPTFTLASKLDAGLLSHDPAVATAYDADPLVHRQVSARFYTEWLKAQQEVLAGAKDFRLPCLILHGGADELTDPDGSRRFYQGLTVADRKLIIYDGFYHELFNETGKEQVFADMEAWLEAKGA